MFKAVIFDFDGTIIPPSKMEKLCRSFFEKIGISRPPRIFFEMGEVIDFLLFTFFGKAKRIIANDFIVRVIKEKRLYVGILTDRTGRSLCYYLKAIGIEAEDLDFVQVRKSFLDFILPCKKFLCSKKVKPDKDVYSKLVLFADRLKIERREVLIIDDHREARVIAKRLGFQAVDPQDKLLSTLLKPESGLV